MMIKLTRISSSHNNLRTGEVVGHLMFRPDVGDSIWIVADPLDTTRDVRHIRTSPIEKIDGNRYYTANSVYEIEFLEPETIQ